MEVDDTWWYLRLSDKKCWFYWLSLIFTQLCSFLFVILWRSSCDLWSDREWIWEVITGYWYWTHISWRAERNINVDIRFMGEKQGFPANTDLESMMFRTSQGPSVYKINGVFLPVSWLEGRKSSWNTILLSKLLYFILGKCSYKRNHDWISPRWRYPYNPGGSCTQTIVSEQLNTSSWPMKL